MPRCWSARTASCGVSSLSYRNPNGGTCHLDVLRAANVFNLSGLATLCENRLGQVPMRRGDVSREESADRGIGESIAVC